MSDKNERSKLLRRLQAAQFAAWEVHLFLDTHPNDTMAIECYKKYSERAKELLAEYNKRFGPITADKSDRENRWEWVENPWPWDNEMECDD